MEPQKHGTAGSRTGLLLTLFPVLFSLGLVVATVPHLWRQSALEASGPVGGPFQLTATDGRAVTERSWPGRFLLVYFGYTHCPAACPTALANMEGALDLLGHRGDTVQALFITIDPHRDTTAWLGRYTPMFGPRLLGLTGTETEVDDAARHYAVAYRVVRTGAATDDYEMEHSSVITLMRPDGKFGASFRADEDPAHLARDIAASLRS